MRVAALVCVLLGCSPAAHEAACDGTPHVGCPCSIGPRLCVGMLGCPAGRWVEAPPGSCGVALPSDAGVTDVGIACEPGAMTNGCPCDGTQPVVCGAVIDFVCAHGTWLARAGTCATMDAGAPCSDERAFSCEAGRGTVCCFGQRAPFLDGPCRAADAGVRCSEAAAVGCPCGDSGMPEQCDGQQVLLCTAGVWQPTGEACGALCASGP